MGLWEGSHYPGLESVRLAVSVTVKGMLVEARDKALDAIATVRPLATSDVPPVRDAGELMVRIVGRLAAVLEDACQQTRVGDGPTHRLQLRLL